jgi:TonB-linked SusC/RagA family outer membrane protein
LLLLAYSPTAAVAQEGRIEGTVTENASGDPLPGVNVVVPSLAAEGIGAATQGDGTFVIENAPAGTYEVEARSIGYRAQRKAVTVEAGETTVVDFALRVSNVELDEIVVSVDAGDTRRRSVGTDIAQVKPQQLEDAVATSFSELLTGRAENVSIQGSSGNVGGGSRIRIRGITSLTQDNNPLLIIDGIRANNSSGVGINRGQTFSRFNDLDPNNIRSIQIVKGPSATALYGSEAAPGVILVETKSGASQDGLRVDFNSEVVASSDVADYPDNYADVTANFGITDPTDARLSEWRTAQNPTTGQVFVLDNPFEDASTSPFQTGYAVNNSLSLQGRTGGIGYYTSLGYRTQDGVLPSNYSDRLNFRANFEGSPSDVLNLRFNVGYSSSDTNLPKSGNNTSGYFLNAIIGQPISAIGTDGSCLGEVLGATDASFCDKNGNIRAGFDKIDPILSLQEVERFNASLQLDATPADWLIGTIRAGADVTNTKFQDAIPFDPDVPFSFAAGGENFLDNERFRKWTLDASLQASYPMPGLSNVEGRSSIGAQYFRDNVDNVSCEGRVFPNDQATACDAAVNLRGFSNSLETIEAGAYFQQQVSFGDYLFVTGAVRLDDDSALGEDVGTIVSPSANASWVVSDMPFWTVDPVSNLRLRVAWGRASQAPVQYSADRTFVISRLGSDAGILAGLSPQNPGNADLGPERSEEIEVGFNAGLLEDRVGAGFTYFRQSVTDAIVNQNVAPSTGFASQRPVNIGELVNDGVEASLSATLLDRERLSWDMRLGLSWTKSEITELGLDEPILFGSSQIFREGSAPGAYISRVIVDAQRRPDGTIDPASIQYADGTLADGSGRRVVGQPFPTNEQSLSTTVRLFGGLRISSLFERRAGHQRYDGNRDFRLPLVLTGTTSSFGRDWAFRQTEVSAVEQAMFEQDFALGNHDAAFIYDADFIRWRELRVNYTIPQRWASGMRASRASVYVGGRNLATLTDYPGLDPEVNQRGARDELEFSTGSAIPTPRTFFAGVRLTF